MQTARGVRVTAVAVIFTLALVGCSSSGDSSGGGTLPGGPPSSSTTLAAGALANASNPKDCNGEVLTPVVHGTLPDVTLGDVVCDGPFAMATVQGGGLPGDGVVFLRFKNNAWTIVANGGVNLEVKNLMPADFSLGAFSAWQLAYQARVNPTVPTTRKPADPNNPSSNTAVTVCEQAVDAIRCDTVPPTVPPVPKTGPDGNPLPTAPPSTSMFCRFNFADPRCKADPLFEG